MSTVYRAFDDELERVVAVKVLHVGMTVDSIIVSRFEREALTGASLPHENIVAVLDRGSDRGRPYIVQEFAGPTNLKQLLTENGPLPLDQALELTIQVARGLAFAHAHGCIHRDVKSQNVLVDGPRAKLADFGIAHSGAGADASTLTGTVLGSADYISPEQAQGRTVDGRSDVYSLGVVLYELLTGRLPFAGDSFVAIAMQHLKSPPPAPRRLRPLPARVDLAVRRALAKDPQQRFQTMEAFAAELGECLARTRGQETGDTIVIPAFETAHHGRRHAILAVAAVALFATLLAIAALHLPGDTKKVAGTPVVKTPRAAAATPLVTVPLRAVAAYDPPPGDGVEDNGRLPLATDGDPSTAWKTEWYASASFGNLKRGVGIVFDAGRPVALDSITIRTDTPGFQAEVRAGTAPDGPFRPASGSAPVGPLTTFRIAPGARDRYFLLWITGLPAASGPNFHADVNEATAKGP